MRINILEPPLYIFSSFVGFSSDSCAVAAYVTVLWALGGYLNTCSYMVAPTCVGHAHKANAAGLMAITSQISHCVGLFMAVLLASIMFGGVVDV